MSPLDSATLNKLQAIKALRDRAGTEGEKDAAQHKLTILLAKHKLTEQDIPSPSFSSRGRTSGFSYEWATDRARRSHQPRRPRQPRDPNAPPRPTKPKIKARERFEKAFAHTEPITNFAWNRVKQAQKAAQAQDLPSNKAAYSRAFYEAAAYKLRERRRAQHAPETATLYNAPAGQIYYRAKSRNAPGRRAGIEFAERVDLSLFVPSQ